jgi:hypothetical protein
MGLVAGRLQGISNGHIFSSNLNNEYELKKAVFWDVAPCRSGVNRRFGGTYRLNLQGRGENKKICT